MQRSNRVKFSVAAILLVLGLIVVAIAIAFIFYRHKLDGSEPLPGLSGDVEVYFDDYGIPHIYADDAADAYRAFGYVHARDRLFQMELMRRVGRGRLSEVFGGEFLKTDMFFRTLGTHRKAEKEAAEFHLLPTETQTCITAYLEGVNAFIQHGRRPLEFVALGIESEPFTVEDIYAIAGYMSYSFSQALRVDPFVEHIHRRFGNRYLKGFDLANVRTDSAETGAPGILDFYGDTLHYREMASATQVQNRDGPPATPRENFRFPLPHDFPIPMLQGSNAWVLAPHRTQSGKVIFANDTHIGYASPAVWYEAHIEFPGHGFYGNFLAGIPFALVGHSRGHAFGLTMFEDDDADFFIEKLAYPDTSGTLAGDSLIAPVKKYRETVFYEGKDSTFTVYETRNGVIINRFLPFDFAEPVAMYWNYTAVETHLIRAFHTMQTAGDIDEFREAVASIASPGLNIHYGDSAGNIAMWSAGRIIHRPPGVDGKRFIPGHADSLGHLGFYPFEKNPQILNPDSGVVYSANQMHDKSEGGEYPGYYAPRTRFERISELLNSGELATVETAKRMALDVVSRSEARMAREIARVVLENPLDETARAAAEKLANWEGEHRLSDVEPTIYYKVLYHIMRYTFTDELGLETFENLMNAGHFLTRSRAEFIGRDDFAWWDDVKTGGQVETRSGIFAQAFDISIRELREELGNNMETWTWDRVHFVEHPHPFGEKSLLRPFFNVGPFPAPGGIETLNNSGFVLNGSGKYVSHNGPAMRIVIDFADVENAVSILPTGNSGNVLSPHYSDQAEAFVAGEFRKMMMNEAEIKKTSKRLVLKRVGE